MKDWRPLALLALPAAALLAIARRARAPSPSPATPATPAPAAGSIVNVATSQVARWSGLTETSPEAEPILRDYWTAVGVPYPGPEAAWSAAFISWVVKHSDAPNALTPSGAHVFYARQAYQDRGKVGRYGAFRPNELQIQAGDILVSNRPGSAALTFEDLTRPGTMIPSHGDVVVAANGDALTLIGGNVRNTVKERPGSATSSSVVAVLRLQRAPRIA